jgi:hypothetical protein
MRVLRVSVVEPGLTRLWCSGCGWTYNIPHVSEISDRAEEEQATRTYVAHWCVDYPADESEKAS